MRNVSNEYLRDMYQRQDFYFDAEITFPDGRSRQVGKGDFAISGNSFSELAGASSFPLGVVAPKQLSLSIINDDDRWSDYDFYYAKILLRVKFDLSSGTTESLNIGTFTVVTPETYGVVIDLTAVDDSYKLDKEYSTGLSYRLTVGEAVRDSCSSCGVSLLTSVFSNDQFVIQQEPENITHRQLIGLCAMIAGGNARFDEYNRLRIVPYDFSGFEDGGLDGGVFGLSGGGAYQTGDTADGGSFRPWGTGAEADGGRFGDRRRMHVLYDFKPGMKVGVDDVVVTGVQFMDEEKIAHLYGKEGYVLSLENQLVAGKEDEAARLVGEKIVGLSFRPFTGDHIPYPLAEFMDLAYILDERGRIYRTVLTDVDFQCFGLTTLKCSADSPVRNSSKYYGNEAKAVIAAKKETEKQISDYDLVMRELTSILANSMGVYETYDVQEDGSRIVYQHNKPTLEESDTIWKRTADAFSVSTNFGQDWNAGITKDGNVIAKVLTVIGINAGWINTGALTVAKDGKVVFSVNVDEKTAEFAGELIAATGTFAGNLSAAGGTFAGELKAATGTFAGELSAATGSFSGSVNIGGNGGNGQLIIKDATGANIGSITKDGVDFQKGTFAGSLSAATGTFAGNLSAAGGTFAGELKAATGTFAGSLSAATGSFKGKLEAATGTFAGDLTVGGKNNESGRLLIYDENGTSIGSITKQGAKFQKGEFSGELKAATGTFAGNLSAAGGTFAGKLSAATGTFSGELKAATGSFKGTVEATTLKSANAQITGGYINIKTESDGSVISLTNSSGYEIFMNPMFIHVSSSGYTASIGPTGFSVLSGSTVKSSLYGSSGKCGGSFHVEGILTADGTKSRVIGTEDFGRVLQYCYETPSPMFGDIGCGKVGEDGFCYIYFDAVFRETVSPDMGYQVFLQKEGRGDLWVEDKQDEFFVVSGTPGLKFSWEAKAKQKGYEYERLDAYDEGTEDEEADYAYQAYEYLNNYEKEIYGYEETD